MYTSRKPVNTLDYFPKKIILLLFSIAVTLTSCNYLPIDIPTDNDSPLEISDEIKDLILFDGNEDAPIVIVNVASGPDSRLSMNDVNAITETFDTTDMLTVNVHQGQTLNPSLIEETDITFEQALDINTQSIETLAKVVTYFKDQGRTVYVFGLSFGAFIIQELISEKGIDVADSYLIMVGRLDINDETWQALAEGRFGLFENGITPIIFNETEPNVIDRNLNRITAATAMNRYTELLAPSNDLSKITYVYGQMDEAVGSLTDVEIEFLQSRNVNLIAGNGGHDETILEFIVQGFNEAFGIEAR